MVPVELAVPAELVLTEGLPFGTLDPVAPNPLFPAGLATFAELPAPLGSLPELFRPAAFAGPLGIPLTAAVPAPVEPALGEPTELAVPVVGPLAAPVAPPPADAPPAPPPPLPPPLCARAGTAAQAIETATIKAIDLIMGLSKR
jgi:hypothetical protein